MSVLDIDELVVFVTPFARSAPEPSILSALRDACRKFCEATKSWRDQDEFTVSAPNFEPLCTTSETDLVAIEDAEIDGYTLEPISVADLTAKRPGWRWDTDEASAKYVTQLTPNSVTIYPRQTGTLKMGLVLQPSVTAVTVPSWLVTKHGSNIGRGAAGQLLILPNTEYANPTLGSALIAEFQQFCDNQALKARKGQQGARLRTKGNFF